MALHGALSQGLRNRRLMALRNGQVQILVATDVAARGIDVPTITHVFNFGLPMKAEDYTHRIGRTGRAGRDGLAVTFAELRDRRKIGDIEAYTRQRINVETVPGLEPRQRAPQPEFGGRGRPAGRGDRFGGGGDRNYADRSNFNARGPAPRGPRFEGRPEGRPEGRFEAPRVDHSRPETRFDPRFEGRAEPQPRHEGRFDNRGEGRGEGGYRNDTRPAGRSFDRAPGARPGFGPKPGGFSSFGRSDKPAGGDRGDRGGFSDRGNAERGAMRGGEFAPRRSEGGPARPVARRNPR